MTINDIAPHSLPGSHSAAYTDLTAAITENTVVFPGDPAFSQSPVASIEHHGYHLRQMHLGNHTGTHLDFPAHVIKGGKTSSDYTVADLIGDGVIIEVPTNTRTIDASFVNSNAIRANDFVFFKTNNSDRLSKQTPFNADFVYIEPDAAQALVELRVRVVGIDYISVDAYHADTLPVHNTLLSNDVLIVENLQLNNVDPGRCQLHILPLNIPDMDGLPARVVMTR